MSYINIKNGLILLTLLSLCFLLSLKAFAKHAVTGTFPSLAGQQVRLVGFNGFDTYTIDSTMVSDKGFFELKYADKDQGMGYLSAADNKSYFVVLTKEGIQLKGELLSQPKSVSILSGEENQLFEQYAVEHSKREQALSAWTYLQNLYLTDSLFSQQKTSQQAIEAEMRRIKQEDYNFLANLNSESYMAWYLPTRKLVSSASKIAKYQPKEIPSTIAAFRKLDYSDNRLYKSGLLIDAIDGHFWLLNNMGQSRDIVLEEMIKSIDLLIESLVADETKLNEITKFLFNLFERHSLFEASEYLSVKVLTQNSCTLNDDLSRKLESYRAMKEGNTAPDIDFSGDVLKGGSIIETQSRLSDIKADYKLVIFGASWCPKCVEELHHLLPLYNKWQSKSIEVVFVSLDTDQSLFKDFSSRFPFISMCDYKKWDSYPVLDYYVFATPTIFLLDKNQKIILRPNSVNQMDAWIDYNIVQ